MLNLIKMRLMQVADLVKDKGWKSLFRALFYSRRKAILVEKNLSEAINKKDFLHKNNVRFIELTHTTIQDISYAFTTKSRSLKARHYLSKGYCGHAIVKDNTIVGDIWYFAFNNPCLTHCPDINWLRFELTEGSVYSFDIFLDPANRGNNLSAALQSTAMHSLYEKGYKKAYAYYWADNIPAIWNTRVINKWKELRPVTVSRFLFWQQAHAESATSYLSRCFCSKGVDHE